MTKFLSKMLFKTRYKAKKECPWAYKIKKCYMGWIAFENNEEYQNYMIEERKSNE